MQEWKDQSFSIMHNHNSICKYHLFAEQSIKVDGRFSKCNLTFLKKYKACKINNK